MLDKQYIKNILSLDAGASKVKAVIFNESGETLGLIENEFGANISINPEESIKRILSTVSEILDNSNLKKANNYNYTQGTIVRDQKVIAIEDKSGTEKMLKKCKSLISFSHDFFLKKQQNQ